MAWEEHPEPDLEVGVLATVDFNYKLTDRRKQVQPSDILFKGHKFRLEILPREAARAGDKRYSLERNRFEFFAGFGEQPAFEGIKSLLQQRASLQIADFHLSIKRRDEASTLEDYQRLDAEQNAIWEEMGRGEEALTRASLALFDSIRERLISALRGSVGPLTARHSTSEDEEGEMVLTDLILLEEALGFSRRDHPAGIPFSLGLNHRYINPSNTSDERCPPSSMVAGIPMLHVDTVVAEPLTIYYDLLEDASAQKYPQRQVMVEEDLLAEFKRRRRVLCECVVFRFTA